jgi:hypothetical protein
MTATYIPLANITLGTAASSVTFSSIPATYRDLVCVVVAQGSTTLDGRIRLNSDTGSKYQFVRMSGSGSAATSATSDAMETSGRLSAIAQATTTSALQMNINIMDYSATDKQKIIISQANNSANGTEAFANRVDITAAITTVQVLTSTGNWAIGSTFVLYGIAS